METKLINCPICNCSKFKKVLSKDMLDEIYTLVSCKSCDLVFFNPLPSQKNLTEYYNGEYAVPLFQQKKVILKSKKVLKLLKTLGLKNTSKIFELGASHGFFLNEVKKMKFEPYGVELSSSACETAKKKFGIYVENNLFDKSSYYNKSNYFDVCCMFDVLEHVTNPNPVIEGFSKILNSNGRVVLTIPNINSTEFKLFGKYWDWLTPPAHLFYYSPKTITKLLSKYGFEIEHLETYRGDSSGNLFFHTYISLRESIFSSLKFFMGRKKLLLKKQYIMDNMDSTNLVSDKEFTGLSGIIFIVSEKLNFILSSFNKKRFKNGNGPTLLVIAKKK
ncbi:MAG: class I SAM-dependent methyltransferase [Nanoarchaeales archaeon]|nr:class I SAM-dependent methyltransferase [Nanoarchaeales archaeon]